MAPHGPRAVQHALRKARRCVGVDGRHAAGALRLTPPVGASRTRQRRQWRGALPVQQLSVRLLAGAARQYAARHASYSARPRLLCVCVCVRVWPLCWGLTPLQHTGQPHAAQPHTA
eukprot:366069-Chlamydomonas_euryale.AAC.9